MKLIISDVDGVLTDGAVLWGEKGAAFKQFSVRDGHGIQLLKEAGWRIIFVTSSKDVPTIARLNHLGVEYYIGIKNKAAFVTSLLASIAEETGSPQLPKFLAVGDDVMDLEFMRMSTITVCPDNAEVAVYSLVRDRNEETSGEFYGFTLPEKEHKFRQLCNLILASSWPELVLED